MSFDAVEFKYILATDASLKTSVDRLMNPDQAPVQFQNEISNETPQSSKFTSGRTNFASV